MKTLVLTAVFAAVLVAPATARDKLKVGELKCEVSGGLGLIITSKKELECHFRSPNGRSEMYHGSIRKFGLDIGATESGILVWEVFAAEAGPRPGALAGQYDGVGGSATVGVGVGANALIGGSNRDFSLQPLSLGLQTGLDLTAGVTSLTLRPGE